LIYEFVCTQGGGKIT